MHDERRTLTVEEASVVLGVSRSVGYAAARDGSLPSIKLGRRIVIPRAKLLELLGEEPTTPSNGNGTLAKVPLADISKAFGAPRREQPY